EKKEISVALEPAETEFVWRLRIARVNPGGQADRLGLLPGDVLLAYEGVEIHSLAGLTGAIESAKQEGLAAASLALERDGKRFEVKVAPGVLGVRLEEFED
ncbi:MAG: PDZ domain-containing protein, partial [Planctomycetota bacterium]